jgi:acetyl esterase/lipase
MKKHLFSVLTVITIFFMGACNEDESIVSGENNYGTLAVSIQQNVAYGNDPQQIYDLYLPEGRNAATTKAIILVHGGGWAAGDKNDMESYIDLILENNPNHAIVNVNYRLAIIDSRAAFPNQFNDLGAIINKLTFESETLQIKPEFGLLGASAGAHISLQYDSVYDTDDQVKFVCTIVGPTDFTDPFYTNNPTFQAKLEFLVDETAYPPGTNLAIALSPALNVSPATSPTIMFYGNQDKLVPLSNANTLKANLESNGVEHQYTIYNAGHGNWELTDVSDMQTKLNVFIKAYLAI